MSDAPILKVRLMLRGRPIRSYEFTQEQVTIGRDPRSDIHLENAGVSRSHARIGWTPQGWVLEDAGSSNGTFLNEQPVTSRVLADRDVVTIGKFSLWVGLESAQAEERVERPVPNQSAGFEGTTVLTRGQLARVMAAARESEAPPLHLVESSDPEVDAVPARRGGLSFIIAVAALAGALIAFLAISLWKGGGIGWFIGR